MFQLTNRQGVFVTEGTPGDVVKKLVAHLHEISRYSHVLLTEKFQPIFEQLDHLIHLDSDGDDPTHDGDSTEGTKRRRKHPAAVVKEQLDNFLQELPVLGFNSGKYDVNVIKRYLYPELQRVDPLQFVVKRTSTYMALSTKMLKFLDIVNYLAPEYSYAKFLKAYDVEQEKGFFPYEWVDDLNKLNATHIRPMQLSSVN